MKTFAVAFVALCLAVAVAGAYHPLVDELVALPTGTAEGAQLCFIGQRPTAIECYAMNFLVSGSICRQVSRADHKIRPQI